MLDVCRLRTTKKEAARLGESLKAMRKEIEEGRQREEVRSNPNTSPTNPNPNSTPLASQVLAEDLSKLEFERDSMHAQATTPGGLAKMLKLSPKSIERVKKAEAGGVQRSASSASPDAKERNRFMERVANCYTPIVEELCSQPLFDGGTTSRPDRVVQQVLKKISQRYKGEAVVKGRRGCTRKLIYNEKSELPKTKMAGLHDQDGIDEHTAEFLREMAGSWRQARLTLHSSR